MQVHQLKLLLNRLATAMGLTINYQKSMSVLIHVPDDHTIELAAILICSISGSPSPMGISQPLSSTLWLNASNGVSLHGGYTSSTAATLSHW